MRIKKNRITYEELSSDFSRYEISCLSAFRAVDIVKSGRALIGDTPYKLKVALVALDELCEDKEAALAYREEIKDRLFTTVEVEAEDEYSVDGLAGLTSSDDDEDLSGSEVD